MERSIKIYIQGIDVVIKKDLKHHKTLLDRSQLELQTYHQALSHEIKKKKHYLSLIGGGKYNDDSLRKSVDGINVNIKHMSDKVKLTQDAIAHHTLIVDTLAKQLEDYNNGMSELAKWRSEQRAINN